MKRWVAVLILTGTITVPSFAAKGPEVDMVDNKLSINVEAVSLARLLRLVDMATGMTSKVPAELANRNISVRFAGMNVADGVKKMFQGQPVDYVMIEGQGIIVTAASQAGSGTEPVPSYNTQPPQLDQQPFVQDFQQPGGFQPNQPIPGQQQPGQPGQVVQPATIQTPFGPMANPRAQQQQQQNVPLSNPGQNSLFPQALPSSQPNANGQPAPFGQPGMPTPFGTNPFGSQTPASNNSTPLFGGQPRTQ
jgi:hypothetical protein